MPFGTFDSARSPFGLFADALKEAIAEGCAVGVGFDYAVLLGSSGPIRHVARIIPSENPLWAMLIDDNAGEPPTETTVKWLDLERAVYAVDDGFWIIGRCCSMELEFAPPWTAGE